MTRRSPCIVVALLCCLLAVAASASVAEAAMIISQAVLLSRVVPMRVEADVASSGTPDSSTDLVGRGESSALEVTPFDHVYLEDLFPPAYYRRLLDHLPETRRYRELRPPPRGRQSPGRRGHADGGGPGRHVFPGA